MRRRGEVIEVTPTHAVVQVSRAGCDRCAAGRGCGAGLMNRLLTPTVFHLNIPHSPADANALQVGQPITLLLDSNALFRLALRSYGFGTLAFMAGCALAYLLLAPRYSGALLDGVVLLAGMASLGLCWCCVMPISDVFLPQPDLLAEEREAVGSE